MRVRIYLTLGGTARTVRTATVRPTLFVAVHLDCSHCTFRHALFTSTCGITRCSAHSLKWKLLVFGDNDVTQSFLSGTPLSSGVLTITDDVTMEWIEKQKWRSTIISDDPNSMKTKWTTNEGLSKPSAWSLIKLLFRQVVRKIGPFEK